MAYWESNGHVTVYVTWLGKFKHVTPIRLEHNISKMAGDAGSVPFPRNPIRRNPFRRNPIRRNANPNPNPKP